jgi:hypothetical protein
VFQKRENADLCVMLVAFYFIYGNNECFSKTNGRIRLKKQSFGLHKENILDYINPERNSKLIPAT